MTTPISQMTDVWNDAGTVFSAITMTITDTAYDTGSRMIDLTTTVAGGFFRVDYLGNMATSGTVTSSAAYVGLFTSEVENTSAAAATVVGATYKVTNDSGYWGLMGMTNSGSTILGGSLIDTFHMYNQGYGDSLNTVDGNKDHVWYTDPTDSHDFSALANEVMRLDADGNLDLSGDIDIGGTVTVAAYTRKNTITASAATLGPTAPTPVTIGTFIGLAFDADAEVVDVIWRIPSDWDGGDITLVPHWTAENAVPLSDGETVKFDITYRSIAEGEPLTNGTVATSTYTYTQSGGGVDVELLESPIPMLFDDANQPLAAGDYIGIQFNRDFTTDTYGSDANVFIWYFEYMSTGLPQE